MYNVIVFGSLAKKILFKSILLPLLHVLKCYQGSCCNTEGHLIFLMSISIEKLCQKFWIIFWKNLWMENPSQQNNHRKKKAKKKKRPKKPKKQKHKQNTKKKTGKRKQPEKLPELSGEDLLAMMNNLSWRLLYHIVQLLFQVDKHLTNCKINQYQIIHSFCTLRLKTFWVNCKSVCPVLKTYMYEATFMAWFCGKGKALRLFHKSLVRSIFREMFQSFVILIPLISGPLFMKFDDGEASTCVNYLLHNEWGRIIKFACFIMSHVCLCLYFHPARTGELLVVLIFKGVRRWGGGMSKNQLS